MEQGSRHTPETKEKIRRALQGQKKSPAHRERIRQARLGQSQSHETREKIGAAHRGKPISAETQAKRASKRPPPSPESLAEKKWIWYLGLALKANLRWGRPRNIGRKTIKQLAQVVLHVGPPSEPEARRCFKALVALLFSRHRLEWTKGESLRKHVALLPMTRDELMKLTWTVEAAQERFENFPTAQFSVANFIAVALKMPMVQASVSGYVDNCLEDPERRQKTIAAIFHPNTFEYQQKRWRGMLGDLAEMNARHAQQVLERVKVITG